MFSIINKDITNQGIKSKINNVILTGQGIVNINKSDVAGKINLNIPVKISTGQGRPGCGARIYSRPGPCGPPMPGRG